VATVGVEGLKEKKSLKFGKFIVKEQEQKCVKTYIAFKSQTPRVYTFSNYNLPYLPLRPNKPTLLTPNNNFIG